MRDGQFTLNGRFINIHPNTGNRIITSINVFEVLMITYIGIMLLHPHPATPDALMMLMIGDNIAALERIGRLFPIRTGITTPSWIMVGPLTDALGAAGVTGAGQVFSLLFRQAVLIIVIEFGDMVGHGMRAFHGLNTSEFWCNYMSNIDCHTYCYNTVCSVKNPIRNMKDMCEEIAIITTKEIYCWEIDSAT